MGKRIEFTEYQAVWMENRASAEISNEDYELLEKEEITLSDITEKYDLEYGDSDLTECMVDGKDTEYEDWYEDEDEDEEK